MIQRLVCALGLLFIGLCSLAAVTPTHSTAVHLSTLRAGRTIYLPMLTAPSAEPIALLPDGGWIEWRALDQRPLIVREAPGFPVQPRSGQWFAWIGGSHLLGETRNNQSRIVTAAPLTLPNVRPLTLQFYYQLFSADQPNESNVCDRDVLNV